MHLIPYHDFDWLLRTPGGVYITVVGLAAFCLVLFVLIGPICERIVRALGLQSAPSLKPSKQAVRGETTRPCSPSGAETSATLFLVTPIGPVGIRRRS